MSSDPRWQTPNARRARRRRHRRLLGLLVVLGIAALAVLLLTRAFEGNILYFRLPSDIVGPQATVERPKPGLRFRLGGLVKRGSVAPLADGVGIRFVVTDRHAEVPVLYRGILPDLFREGQGVIADGAFDADGVFVADRVLAKHDEKYMPREVYERIRKAGHPAGIGGPAPRADGGGAP